MKFLALWARTNHLMSDSTSAIVALLWGCNYINEYNWGKNTLALLCNSHFSSGRFQSVPAGLGCSWSEANASTQDRAAQLGLFLILTPLWCQISPVEHIGHGGRCAPLLVSLYSHTHAHLLTHMKTSVVVLEIGLGVENGLKTPFWGSWSCPGHGHFGIRILNRDRSRPQ